MDVCGEIPPRHQPFGSVAAEVAYHWRQFSLALILPQRFPEHVSDADIEATVRHVVATEVLPWTIYDEDMGA